MGTGRGSGLLYRIFEGNFSNHRLRGKESLIDEKKKKSPPPLGFTYLGHFQLAFRRFGLELLVENNRLNFFELQLLFVLLCLVVVLLGLFRIRVPREMVSHGFLLLQLIDLKHFSLYFIYFFPVKRNECSLSFRRK